MRRFPRFGWLWGLALAGCATSSDDADGILLLQAQEIDACQHLGSTRVMVTGLTEALQQTDRGFALIVRRARTSARDMGGDALVFAGREGNSASVFEIYDCP